MFEKLEKDTEKVINDSKSGTRFFGSYSNEYRTETYTNEKADNYNSDKRRRKKPRKTAK